MPSRFGQQAAAGLASGLGNLANMTLGIYDRQREDERNALLDAEAAKAKKMAHDLAMKKLEADSAKNAPNPNLSAFEKWINENPNASFEDQNRAALRFMVSGTDEANNFLGNQKKSSDINYRASEQKARGDRFSEAMDFKKSKAQRDYDFAQQKFTENLELATRAQDEREAENLRNNAVAWARIAETKRNSLMSYANRGGFTIDNDEELLAASQEIEDNKKELSQMESMQSIALPDPMLKSKYDNLLKKNSDLEKAVSAYVIKGSNAGSSAGVGTVLQQTTTTPLGLTPPVVHAKPKKQITVTPVNSAPATNQQSEAESLISIMNQQRNR